MDVTQIISTASTGVAVYATLRIMSGGSITSPNYKNLAAAAAVSVVYEMYVRPKVDVMIASTIGDKLNDFTLG